MLTSNISKRLNSVCLLAALSLLILPACNNNSATAQQQNEEKGLRVLFIGNSLTYANDLPGMLEKLLKNAGVKVDEIAMAAFPNFALEDHWNQGPEGLARRLLRDKKWDVVAMQQGPSATEGRPSLIAYTKIFDEPIKKAGGRTALYMVWPSQERSFDFDGVSESHQMAADAVGGLLFPAGEAWRAAWRRDPKLALYGSDGFHPSLLGTYLAALVMFQQLGEKDPRDLPAEIPNGTETVKIDPALADLLQEAAVEANEKFARE